MPKQVLCLFIMSIYNQIKYKYAESVNKSRMIPSRNNRGIEGWNGVDSYYGIRSS